MAHHDLQKRGFRCKEPHAQSIQGSPTADDVATIGEPLPEQNTKTWMGCWSDTA